MKDINDFSVQIQLNIFQAFPYLSMKARCAVARHASNAIIGPLLQCLGSFVMVVGYCWRGRRDLWAQPSRSKLLELMRHYLILVENTLEFVMVSTLTPRFELRALLLWESITVE